MRYSGTHLQVVILFAIIFFSVCLGTGALNSLHAQSLTGSATGGGPINLQTATSMTSNYQQSVAPGTVRAVYFSNAAIQMVTNEIGAVGVRIYFSRQSDGTLTVVLVGVDANGRDLTAGPLIDTSNPCPPFCDSTSSLNH